MAIFLADLIRAEKGSLLPVYLTWIIACDAFSCFYLGRRVIAINIFFNATTESSTCFSPKELVRLALGLTNSKDEWQDVISPRAYSLNRIWILRYNFS